MKTLHIEPHILTVKTGPSTDLIIGYDANNDLFHGTAFIDLPDGSTAQLPLGDEAAKSVVCACLGLPWRECVECGRGFSGNRAYCSVSCLAVTDGPYDDGDGDA